MFHEAEKRNLKILFDYVISYSSIHHPWFQESAKQEKNKYSNWYIWTDNQWVNPPQAYRDAFIKGYSRRNGQFMRNFLTSYMDQYEKTVGHGYINLPLGNHDLSRLNIKRSTDDLEVIYAFSLTMPGIPFIFYGNEIGMRQLYGLPFVEGAYKPRAGGRTPMQWNDGVNRGFSSADPEQLYLPVDTEEDAPNVKDQESDPNSLLNRVRRLIDLKKSEPAFTAYAEFVPVYAVENEYPFVYARANGDDMALVILNPREKAASAEFDLKPAVSELELLAGTELKIKRDGSSYDLDIPGRSYAIYKMIK